MVWKQLFFPCHRQRGTREAFPPEATRRGWLFPVVEARRGSLCSEEAAVLLRQQRRCQGRVDSCSASPPAAANELLRRSVKARPTELPAEVCSASTSPTLATARLLPSQHRTAPHRSGSNRPKERHRREAQLRSGPAQRALLITKAVRAGLRRAELSPSTLSQQG